MDSFLRIKQSPEELNELYGERDYYWYLRHPVWIDRILKPMAYIINRVGSCLDVGCGEAILGDLKKPGTRYCGFDGSMNAIKRAEQRNSWKRVRYGDIDNPHIYDPPSAEYSMTVFGGILQTLIKEDRRLEFLEFYRGRFFCEYFLIQDLESLDTRLMKERYDSVEEHHISLPSEAFDGKLEETKLHRKVMLFKCQ